MKDWQREREQLRQRVASLRDDGVCPTCYDLESGELFELYGDRERLIYEDELFRALLDRYPRMLGHTIIVYKPHREDISELLEDEARSVVVICLRLIKAIKEGLGAEKVYLITECDGPRTHLHFQLFPRYEGDEGGSRRFVLPRAPVENAEATAARIRGALASL